MLLCHLLSFVCFFYTLACKHIYSYCVRLVNPSLICFRVFFGWSFYSCASLVFIILKYAQGVGGLLGYLLRLGRLGVRWWGAGYARCSKTVLGQTHKFQCCIRMRLLPLFSCYCYFYLFSALALREWQVQKLQKKIKYIKKFRKDAL